jgi:O-antigen/teichoic acid export membrane protein
MIQKLVGDGPAGIYNLAYTISICGTLINQAVLQTIQPWVYQKIKEEKYSDIRKLAYPALVMIGCINLLVILVAPELIMIFAPASYNEAIWVMPPVSLSVYYMFTYNLFSYFEFYFEKPVYVSAATFIGAGLNVILNYIFIKQFGYVAAGYTTLVCYFAFAVAHYCFMKIICKKEISGVKVYDIKIIAAISLAITAGGFIIMLTYNNRYIRYGLLVAALIACVLKRNFIKDQILSLLGKKQA